MLSQDAEAFETLIQDLCLAFNRPYTTQLSRVFWESLKHMRLDEVKRAADVARKSLKKFPTPKDLIPERRIAQFKPKEPDLEMSRWAVAANKILFKIAYEDERRGFRPIAEYADAVGSSDYPRLVKPTDDSLLRRCLAVKSDYVSMAEEAERYGEPMPDEEFVGMCRHGFEQLLTPKAVMHEQTANAE